MNHFEEHKYDIKNETVFAPLTKGLLGTVNTNTITYKKKIKPPFKCPSLLAIN